MPPAPDESTYVRIIAEPCKVVATSGDGFTEFRTSAIEGQLVSSTPPIRIASSRIDEYIDDLLNHAWVSATNYQKGK